MRKEESREGGNEGGRSEGDTVGLLERGGSGNGCAIGKSVSVGSVALVAMAVMVVVVVVVVVTALVVVVGGGRLRRRQKRSQNHQLQRRAGRQYRRAAS